MNNNRLKMVSAILLVCLTVLACRAGATPTVAPATSQIVVPADTPTETTGVTNEPLHEIYAGYTGNKALPYIMIHKSGESLVAIQDANSVNISGVVWNSADGKSIVIHSNSNGLPTLAIVGTDIILYSNYTNDTVDLTIIHADGTRMTIPAKLAILGDGPRVIGI